MFVDLFGTMTHTLKATSEEQIRERLLKRSGTTPYRAFDLSALNGIRCHTPEDLTATVGAGTVFSDMQRSLAKHGQWLPVDPPNGESLSVGALIAGNRSGPQRFGFGLVRDYLIGIRVVLADGSVSNSGGQVVKNVAGFDLPRLMVGSRGSLGVIVEATFKLGPVPESRAATKWTFSTVDALLERLRRVESLHLAPVSLDAHNLDRKGQPSDRYHLVLGFAGSEEEVTSQVDRLNEIESSRSSRYDYETAFWGTDVPIRHASCLPTEMGAILRDLEGSAWVARIGNGVVYHHAESPAPARKPSPLEVRLKALFDPEGVLPPIPLT